ncbi:MAG: hypothetical protein ACFE9S_18575 [Candidatus Hermodarchaeota archaeon]
MSSGKIEQNYFKIVQDDLPINESVIFSEDILHKSHQFKSELYNVGRNKEINYKIQDLSFRIENSNFDTIKKIHYILKNSQNLTQKQKFDYCSSQRFYMKLYLKDISERI